MPLASGPEPVNQQSLALSPIVNSRPVSRHAYSVTIESPQPYLLWGKTMGKPVIKSNTVIKSGGKFIQLVKVCNESDKAETLWLTSWSWVKDKGKPKEKISKTRKGKKVTLKKGECKTLTFEHSKKPYQFYTDLYRYKDAGNHQGLWFGWNVSIVKIFDLDKFLEQLRKVLRWSFWLLAFLPYPMRLEPGGKKRQFVIHDVKGLPDGWRVSSLYPRQGQAVSMEPNRKNDQMLVQFSANQLDPELQQINIVIEAGVVGQPNTPLNRIPIGIRAVKQQALPQIVNIRCDPDPKYPHLQFTVDVEDEQGLLETPEILYSTDGGETWEQQDMELLDAQDFTDLGLRAARFTTSIFLPSMKAKALVGIKINDQLGNSNATSISRWPKQASRTKRKRK